VRFWRSYVCNKLRRMSRRVSFDSRRRHHIHKNLQHFSKARRSSFFHLSRVPKSEVIRSAVYLKSVSLATRSSTTISSASRVCPFHLNQFQVYRLCIPPQSLSRSLNVCLGGCLADKTPSYSRANTTPETALTARRTLRFGHLRSDQADDDHHNGAPNTTTTDAGKN